MFLRRNILAAAVAMLAFAPVAHALELVMVEQQGCSYCIAWKEKIGPIYPKTAEGAFAPVRMIDIADTPSPDLTLQRRVVFTPTFVLVEDGTEIGRIEGYPGEDFFWGLLGMLLQDKTDFAQQTETN